MMMDFGAEMVKPCLSAHSSIFDAGAVRASHLSNFGVETENSGVICIGFGENVGLQECGGKGVK